jgi:hypothetical protein
MANCPAPVPVWAIVVACGLVASVCLPVIIITWSEFLRDRRERKRESEGMLYVEREYFEDMQRRLGDG